MSILIQIQKLSTWKRGHNDVSDLCHLDLRTITLKEFTMRSSRILSIIIVWWLRLWLGWCTCNYTYRKERKAYNTNEPGQYWAEDASHIKKACEVDIARVWSRYYLTILVLIDRTVKYDHKHSYHRWCLHIAYYLWVLRCMILRWRFWFWTATTVMSQATARTFYRPSATFDSSRPYRSLEHHVKHF